MLFILKDRLHVPPPDICDPNLKQMGYLRSKLLFNTINGYVHSIEGFVNR